MRATLGDAIGVERFDPLDTAIGVEMLEIIEPGIAARAP